MELNIEIDVDRLRAAQEFPRQAKPAEFDLEKVSVSDNVEGTKHKDDPFANDAEEIADKGRRVEGKENDEKWEIECAEDEEIEKEDAIPTEDAVESEHERVEGDPIGGKEQAGIVEVEQGAPLECRL